MDKMGLGVWSLVFTCGCFLMVSGTGNCPWSTLTLKEVPSCPTNKTAVDLRKTLKNCEMWANRQNCTSPEKFSYHCLMNENENAVVEVCAPEYFIYGYCAEYNTVGERIYPHYSMKCSNVTPPCGSRYISTDAYLYKGCYAAVKREQTVTFGDNTTIELSGDELDEAAIGKIIAAVMVSVITAAVFFVAVFYFNRKRQRQNEMRNNDANTHLMREQEEAGNIERNYDIDRKYFKTVLIHGRRIRDDLIIAKGMKESMADTEERTLSYLKAYEKVNKRYVETELTNVCKQKLEKYGMAVLIGQQGAGKTLTAVHIMMSKNYENWIKLKVKSFEDLAIYEFENNTIVYIGNLFDGFLYEQKVDIWLDSLCSFYFECIKQKSNIHLMITTKRDVIERAFSFIKSDVQTLIEKCSVQDDSFQLSVEEKEKILTCQINLAKESENINVHCTRTLLKSEIRKKTYPIGFPLCAHLYAFEERTHFENALIFYNPGHYVRNYIRHKIEEDTTQGVKTLFLLLVFCGSPEAANSSENLNLMDGKECEAFLRTKTSKKSLKKLEPLSFDHLNEKAHKLEGNVLIKHNEMFEFKHQIYLESVRDYFFGNFFEDVVDHFPLCVLRTYELHDNSAEEVSKLVSRVIQEIAEGAIAEALSCQVFKNPEFEQKVCNALQNDVVAKLISTTDKTSGYEFPTIFWASKYNLKKISKLLLDFARSQIDDPLQFCLAKFGDCCAKDETYVTKATFPLTIENLQGLVDNFKPQEGNKNLKHDDIFV